MKISYNWLRQYLNINIPASDVAQHLTHCGLEVESMESFETVKGGLNGLVIGEVKTKIQHPNADRLSLTTVDIGTGTLLSIVCGAPNVAAGQKVVVATVGTKLFPTEGEPFEIKKSKIRGENSEGMICAEDEIGLGKSHEGIIILPDDTVVGILAKDFFKVEEDVIFEIGLTPNRADAASHYGVARDLAAVLKAAGISNEKAALPSVDNFKTENNSLSVKVEVQNATGCPRYSGITISNVLVEESPAWLKNRLLSTGIHPINNIVDITNFVMHECGQPLHAFDVDEIKGNKIVVRNAKEGEKFITLDSVERILTANDMMICDAEKPMCIAGVFGGMNSGIKSETKNIFIESAYFNPKNIRKTAKHHGLKTDASFRFERGTDPEMTLFAMKRAALMMKEIARGIISSEVVDVYPEKISPNKISVSYSGLKNIFGGEIPAQEIKSILISLGISVEKETEDGMELLVPSYKNDVLREVDIAEEVLRIYGYNKIPFSNRFSFSFDAKQTNNKEKVMAVISNTLVANGFHELLTNSLINASFNEPESSVSILNPLSNELNALRQSMMHSGLSAIQYNRNRQHHDLKFFEFGKTYRRNENKFDETTRLALFMTGRNFPETWNAENSEADFFALKSVVQSVFDCIGLSEKNNNRNEEIISDEVFSKGLIITANTKALVTYGGVKKNIAKQFDVNSRIFFADFNFDLLLKLIPQKDLQVQELSRFPQVRRDLALLINKDISFSSIKKVAEQTERKLLKEVHLFDVYEGENIEEGKKSYALSFVLQDNEQTLTDREIEKVMNRLMENFEKQIGAIIRK